jgi:hypothetical protein
MTRAFPYSVARSWETESLWTIAMLCAIVGLDFWRGEGATSEEGKHYDHETVAWALKGLVMLGLAWGTVRFLSFVWRIGDPKFVEVRADSAVLPRTGLRRGFFTVRFPEIRSIEMTESEKEDEVDRTLTVETSLGKSKLLSAGFRSMAEFDEFSGVLITHWRKVAKPNPLISKTKRAKPSVVSNPMEESLVAAIAEQKKNDPLVGAKLAGKEILARLIDGMKNERGVHAESLLCALGALAGYACQASVRASAVIAGMNPDALFQVAETKDGQQFYFGDALNVKLAEDKHSVWSLAAGAAQHAGATSLPDIHEIFKRTAALVGTPQFGVPKRIEGHAAGDLPLSYLEGLWAPFQSVVKKLTADPALWPIAYALAIQEAIALTSKTLPPLLGLTIVMEAAIPMSKVKL